MIKPGMLTVKTMKSISHPQVTVLEIKTVIIALVPGLQAEKN